ncbi:MAG: WS/DGAT domain-containing protein [Actinomycetota bacterium]
MITAMVPVSLRTSEERGTTGNRVANVHARLPVGQRDPLTTLQMVHAHLEDLKTSPEVDATGALMNIGANVPRFVADRIARAVVRRQRNVETAITNVPGPREPLYLGLHKMAAGYPVAPIAGQVRLTIAIWSYCDTLSIGVTGDRDTTADLDVVVDGIRRGMDDLQRAAGAPIAR